MRHAKTELILSTRLPSSHNDGQSVSEVSLTKQVSENMAVKILRASSQEINECNFLLSCRPFVQRYLSILTDFDKIREKEAVLDRDELNYYFIKINNLYQNMNDCIEILTKYAKNQIMVESSKFNRDLINNRRRILDELDFMEMFCLVLNLYYDHKDLINLEKGKGQASFNRASTVEGTIMTEDLSKQDKKEAAILMRFNRYYSRYMRNGEEIIKRIYVFLQSLVQNHESNQKKLFTFLHTFQKHFPFFEQSLDLALLMIEDNSFILTRLSSIFFESLKAVNDLLAIKHKMKYYRVDVEMRDQEDLLYREKSELEKKIEKKEEEEEHPGQPISAKSGASAGRPISLLVYLLILLTRGVRKPVILRILSASCTFKGQSFLPNQHNFIELFTRNNELLLLFMAELTMKTYKSVNRLVTRFDEDPVYTFLFLLFRDQKPPSSAREDPPNERILFVTEQINFYSTLCFGRNLKWKHFIREHFKKGDLMNEILDTTYSNGRPPLTRLQEQSLATVLHDVHRLRAAARNKDSADEQARGRGRPGSRPAAEREPSSRQGHVLDLLEGGRQRARQREQPHERDLPQPADQLQRQDPRVPQPLHPAARETGRLREEDRARQRQAPPRLLRAAEQAAGLRRYRLLRQLRVSEPAGPALRGEHPNQLREPAADLHPRAVQAHHRQRHRSQQQSREENFQDLQEDRQTGPAVARVEPQSRQRGAGRRGRG